MKKILYLMSFFLISSSVSIGQNIQLGTYIGHQTPASLELYFGKFRTLSGTSYGGTLSFGQGPGGTNIYRNSWVELQYNYKSADLSYFDYTLNRQFDAGTLEMHNILLGPIKEAHSGRLRPYGGVLLGGTVLVPQFTTNEFRFTASFVGGAKLDITDRIGARFQAQMLMPFYFSETQIGWSPQYGTTAGLSSSSVIFSASFNAGIYINLMKDLEN
ncbi:MAG: hypothetical protein ACKOKB_09570 [Bacteroidota bacterium]